MTLKEAADVLRTAEYHGQDQQEAFEMAIKALDNLRLICANAYIIERLTKEVTDDE